MCAFISLLFHECVYMHVHVHFCVHKCTCLVWQSEDNFQDLTSLLLAGWLARSRDQRFSLCLHGDGAVTNLHGGGCCYVLTSTAVGLLLISETVGLLLTSTEVVAVTDLHGCGAVTNRHSRLVFLKHRFWNWTQISVLARQESYQLSYPPPSVSITKPSMVLITKIRGFILLIHIAALQKQPLLFSSYSFVLKLGDQESPNYFYFFKFFWGGHLEFLAVTHNY